MRRRFEFRTVARFVNFEPARDVLGWQTLDGDDTPQNLQMIALAVLRALEHSKCERGDAREVTVRVLEAPILEVKT